MTRIDGQRLTIPFEALPPRLKEGQAAVRWVLVQPAVRLEVLEKEGLAVPARRGGVMRLRVERVGRPWRMDLGAMMAAHGEDRKGWWGVRVRSEFGAESVLRWWPKGGKVDGMVRVK